jgi:uncharacterized membrane protein YkoI
MKNLIILLFLALVFNSIVFGQKVKPVPTAVRKSFSQKFPKIKRVIWDNSVVKIWEAEFRIHGNEYSVLFDIKGDWIKTEHEIDANEIPSIVKSTLKKEFAGYKIKESILSETNERKVYEFILKKSVEVIKVEINVSGNVISKVQVKDPEIDEDEHD